MDRKKVGTWEKICYIFDEKQKLKAALLFVVIIIGAFVELVGVSAVLPFISAVLSPDQMLENPYLGGIYRMLGFRNINEYIVFLGGAIIVVYIVKNIYVYRMHSMQYRFTYENQRRLSYKMMDCYMKQPYLFHLDHNSAELSRNINEDTVSFFEAILAGLQLASEGGVCLALLLFLLYQDVTITLGVIALVGLFGLVFMKVFKKRLKAAGRRSRDKQGSTRQAVLEALGGIKEIKVLNREHVFVEEYNEEYKDYAESNRRFKVYGMIPKPVMETISISGLLLIVCVKVALGADAASFVPTISVFAMAAFRMLPSANRMAEYLSRIMFSKPAIDAIYHDLKEIDSLLENMKAAEDTADIIFEKEITVHNISFHYPNTEKNVFSDASLVIPKNKSVALIGPSGQGKTTMADIILGLLEPQKGEVLVDGVNIRNGIHAWNRKLGYIPQTISLLDASIRDNILFGIGKDKIDESRLQEALKEAQLKEFVDTLEDGLDTVIGEGGVRLSGGQRQRIGIARALYHNPEVLVLDEATSALDNDTEAAVMEAIDYLAGSKTLIIIAHRLSTIQNCDLVYRIEGGAVSLQP
ncbi:MAG: ABC transporter ATP-binding protein [Lachnospiraceae bacterium]|nr:ABC transporter ATP-binding protein [Lachnospiraceae bacterium]